MGQVFPAGSPFDTQTRMFPIVLPLPRASISLGTGPECFFAHTGSASIASGLSVGTFPSKVTVPVTDDAARATPGHTTAAASPAARHNLFAVLRILVSLVMSIRLRRRRRRCPPAEIEWAGGAQKLDSEQTVHRPSRACNAPTPPFGFVEVSP
jgi:hypothetical protein